MRAQSRLPAAAEFSDAACLAAVRLDRAKRSALSLEHSSAHLRLPQTKPSAIQKSPPAPILFLLFSSIYSSWSLSI
jgi:hypothetical protein